MTATCTEVGAVRREASILFQLGVDQFARAAIDPAPQALRLERARDFEALMGSLRARES